MLLMKSGAGGRRGAGSRHTGMGLVSPMTCFSSGTGGRGGAGSRHTGMGLVILMTCFSSGTGGRGGAGSRHTGTHLANGRLLSHESTVPELNYSMS